MSIGKDDGHLPVVRRVLPAAALLAVVVVSAGRAWGAADEAPPGEMLDLTRAVVVAPAGLSRVERKAVAMLVEEVERRTGVRWAEAPGRPGEGGPVVAVGRASTLREADPRSARGLGSDPGTGGAEGYRIRVEAEGPSVVVAGNDERGVLFGVGRLLRELRLSRGRALLPSGFGLATAPRFALRGHQLGYRPKTNSYDGWDLAQWERYIRDLAVFGANAVELIPPRSDDAADSPHFPLAPIAMMEGMSRLLDDYGLDVWIWYPAMDAEYADPATVDRALAEWGDVFRRLPRIDAVFVPGGDPGHTRPAVLMAFLEKVAAVLRRHHPRAQMWVSPQSFDRTWFDEFLAIVRERPRWLTGIVHGPQVRVGIRELRELVPPAYPIRSYPDITHCRQCQFPVPDWDLAYALTEGREPINPRPLGQAAIFRAQQEAFAGFLTYSEGCNDDVNKAVWSALGWDPEASVVEALRQYGRYFLGERQADAFAQGLLALERNWQGPLLTNAGVETTLRQFQDLERAARPGDLLNWRFQQALYRAYYDAYVRDRLIAETALEAEARAELRRAGEVGALAAIGRAEAILDRAQSGRVSGDRRARVHELAEALFQSVRMQLSVGRYRAIAVGRGANLDAIDVPLNDRAWLLERFAELRALSREGDRLKGIAAVLGRTDPGPGGFYDDLGDPARQPHLVRGEGFARDPGFRRSSLVGFGQGPGWPLAWWQNAQSVFDAPLRMRYEGLDPSARYVVRVVYAGDRPKARIRLDADEAEVHPLLVRPEPIQPVEFAIPPAATADGTLELRWTPEPGQGGNGRGCQVAEVWLIRKEDGPERGP